MTTLDSELASLLQDAADQAIDIADLRQAMEETMYNGFDPEITFNECIASFRRSGKSTEQFMKYLTKALALIISGGSSIFSAKKQQNISEAGVAALQEMVTVLGIKYHKGKCDPRIVTGQRLIACCTPRVCAMIRKEKALWDRSMYSRTGYTGDLEFYYCFPGSNGLYPHDEARNAKYIEYMTCFRDLVKGDREKSIEDFAQITRDGGAKICKIWNYKPSK
jgi:hypothetical protein